MLLADLMKRFMMFKGYGKDALLLSLLAYNVEAGRLLGYSNYPKSHLSQMIESGKRDYYREHVAFC